MPTVSSCLPVCVCVWCCRRGWVCGCCVCQGQGDPYVSGEALQAQTEWRPAAAAAAVGRGWWWWGHGQQARSRWQQQWRLPAVAIWARWWWCEGWGCVWWGQGWATDAGSVDAGWCGAGGCVQPAWLGRGLMLWPCCVGRKVSCIPFAAQVGEGPFLCGRHCVYKNLPEHCVWGHAVGTTVTHSRC